MTSPHFFKIVKVQLLNFSWHLVDLQGFPDGSVVKNPPAGAGDMGERCLIPGFGRFPGGGLFVFLLGKSHEQRSLAGYCPWGRKRVGCD